MKTISYERQATRIADAYLNWQTAAQDQDNATQLWRRAIRAQEEADATWSKAQEAQAQADMGNYYEELQPLHRKIDQQREKANEANDHNHKARAAANPHTTNAAELHPSQGTDMTGKISKADRYKAIADDLEKKAAWHRTEASMYCDQGSKGEAEHYKAAETLEADAQRYRVKAKEAEVATH